MYVYLYLKLVLCTLYLVYRQSMYSYDYSTTMYSSTRASQDGYLVATRYVLYVRCTICIHRIVHRTCTTYIVQYIVQGTMYYVRCTCVCTIYRSTHIYSMSLYTYTYIYMYPYVYIYTGRLYIPVVYTGIYIYVRACASQGCTGTGMCVSRCPVRILPPNRTVCHKRGSSKLVAHCLSPRLSCGAAQEIVSGRPRQSLERVRPCSRE